MTADNNLLLRRQEDRTAYYDGFWYSNTAYIIKWAIIGAIFVLCIAFFVGGYLHAKQRMKKGIAPLAYHRWLIPRRQRLAFYSAHPHLPNPYANDIHYQNQHAVYRPGYGDSRANGHAYAYPMNQMPPPPPAYGQEEWVPAYSANPPVGGTKVNPDQGQGGNLGVGVREVGMGQGQAQGQGSAGQAQGHPGGDLAQAHVR